jgi:hypothetical protein
VGAEREPDVLQQQQGGQKDELSEKHEERMFFFEKKNQKTFPRAERGFATTCFAHAKTKRRRHSY